MIIQPIERINGYHGPEYKQCAGAECEKPGTNCLKVRFIHKKGWFCDSCSNNLIEEGLIECESEDEVAIR